MKAFFLLILVSVAVFIVMSIIPARDIVKFEQISEPILDELDTPILEEDNLEELVGDSLESEIEEEIVVVEEKMEEVIEAPEVVFAPVEELVVVQEQVEEPKISFSEINTNTREALVNIFCTTKSGGACKPITGSGVIIDELGVILTNAHVAQYFLLKDYLVEDFVQCTIRTGSPAKPKYKAKLLFISPSWVKENANGIIQQEPKGTGEDDYALLLITERTDPTKTIPDTFSFIPPEYNSDKIGVSDEVLLAAYPAGFLGGISIQRDLYISSAVIKVIELFTFREGTLDLFSIGGSVVAQQGSSGGAVVSDENKLLGIIVTSSVAESTEDRDLRAITIAHINRSFTRDALFDLQALFSVDLIEEARIFNENTVPQLTQLLVDELEK